MFIQLFLQFLDVLCIQHVITQTACQFSEISLRKELCTLFHRRAPEVFLADKRLLIAVSALAVHIQKARLNQTG